MRSIGIGKSDHQVQIHESVKNQIFGCFTGAYT